MKYLLFFILISNLYKAELYCQDKPVPRETLYEPALVNKFYLANNNNLFWMQDGVNNAALRSQLLLSIDSADRSGLNAKKYHRVVLHSFDQGSIADSSVLRTMDRLYTDAAIVLAKDIYQGLKTVPWVGYDQLSDNYAEQDNEYLLRSLLNASNPDSLRKFFISLEPRTIEYISLKNAFNVQREKSAKDTMAMLQLSMNYYRWIHHFRFEKFIVIDLPAARLQYFEKDSLVLEMKTVVGKPSTPTPRFATICDQAILYPYWYVPRSITFNEYLPKIKANPGWIDAQNMQVIDGSGKVMDHMKMNWSSFHNGYFPYTIRQSTGCDNALGVIKFNIISPYGVYLHDTNNKTAFLSGLRFYSHGCIRIEDPFALGNRLLAGRLDTGYLQSCYKEQKPTFIPLAAPVPVFSVYMQAMADQDGKIRYYKDVYKLN